MKLRTLIIIIVVVLTIVAIGLYFLLSRGNANPTAPTGTGQAGSLPSTGNQQFPGGQGQTGSGNGNGGGNNNGGGTNTGASAHFGVVSSEPALDYFVDAQNHATIIGSDGEIKAITTSNQTSVLSSSTFQNIVSAAFSYDGKKALVSFISDAGKQASVYDVASKKWTKLPTGMQSPVWSPNSYQIAYLQSTGAGSETIYTVNAATAASAGAKPTALSTITAQDSMLQWANKTTLVISDKPSVYAAGSSWLYNIQNRTLAPVALENPGLETQWSNTTTTLGLVFSAKSGNSGGSLALVSATGGSKAVSFATLPSKCGFSLIITTSTTPTSTTVKVPKIVSTSSLSIFCAVPRDQQTFSIARLPDEYEQKILFTADDFYKINAMDGTLNTVFSDQGQTLDATNLKMFNNTLFFINRYDSRLYAISL